MKIMIYIFRINWEADRKIPREEEEEERMSFDIEDNIGTVDKTAQRRYSNQDNLL